MPVAKRRGDRESFEKLFRRWKRLVEKDGTLQTYREKEFYEKPSLRRKKAKQAAIKRHKRALADERSRMRKGNLSG